MGKRADKVAEMRCILEEARTLTDSELLVGLAGLAGTIENARHSGLILEGVRRYQLLEVELVRTKTSPIRPNETPTE